MAEIVRCSRCILSAAIPKINFDEQGRCNFCRQKNHAAMTRDIIASTVEKIRKLITEKKASGQYDAIMCYSGGKDSTYTLMLAIQKYDLNVLSFTLDNGFISETAFKNIGRIVDRLGVDHVTIRPSKSFMKELVRASAIHAIYHPKFLTRISSICNSCISLVNIMALRTAIEKKIPFILAGFTLGQIPAQTIIYRNNYRFLQESRQNSLQRLKDQIGDVVERYFTIPDALLEQVKEYPYNLNLLCLEDISEKEIVKHVEQLGWRAPTDVDGCSTNCRLNVFNNYVHQQKLGYNPYEWELSHLIRSGQMSREDALKKIYDQPQDQIKEVMSELGIDTL